MANQYFVTGTDTDVGKTVVSTILALGLKANYWKPVQTGSSLGTDSQFVGQWLGSDRIHKECYVYPDPLSPHLAARNADQEIDPQYVIDSFPKNDQPLIVEGAGGLLVPFNDRFMVIDLIDKLKLPTVLVASTRLGTINHTLLSIQALQLREIPIAGIVTVGEELPQIFETLKRHSGVPMIGHVPRVDSFHQNWFSEVFSTFCLNPKNESKDRGEYANAN